jgi:hypothetical protein
MYYIYASGPRFPLIQSARSVDYEFTCIDIPKLFLAAPVCNTIQDFITVILPIPIVWKLQLPVRQKLVVIGIFSAGMIAVVAAAIKTYYLYYAVAFTFDITVRTPRVGKTSSETNTWYSGLDGLPGYRLRSNVILGLWVPLPIQPYPPVRA